MLAIPLFGAILDLFLICQYASEVINAPIHVKYQTSNARRFSYPNPEKFWKDRFLRLQYELELNADNISRAKENLDQMLKQNAINRFSVVFYSPGQKNGQWIYPSEIQDLITHLNDPLGFKTIESPYVLPMDRQTGFHVVLFFGKS